MLKRCIYLFVFLLVFCFSTNLFSQSLLSTWPERAKKNDQLGAKTYNEDEPMPTLRVFLSNELVDYSKEPPKEDKFFPSASMGFYYSNKNFLLSASYRVTQNPDPIKESFGRYIYNPPGTGSSRLCIDLGYIIDEKNRWAFRLYFSSISNDWAYQDLTTNSENTVKVDVYNIGIGVYKNIFKIPVNSELIAQSNFFAGLTMRFLGGDIIGTEYDEIRKSLLNDSTDTSFMGVGAYIDFIIGPIKAFGEITHLGDDTIPGLRHLRYTVGIGVFVNLFDIFKPK